MSDPARAYRPVPLRQFARLKLRLLGNGFRGRASRVALFVVGVILGLYFGAVGFLLLAASNVGDAQGRLIVASFTGTALVLGSVLLPLVWFGIDDTLDPARFSLLPVPRPRLMAGLLVAALLSVPAAAVLIATAGLLVPATVHGGAGAGAVQLVGSIGGLVLCVAAARSVTSAFATALRSRRVRDLAGIGLALLVALLVPLQVTVLSGAQRADLDQIAAVARVIGWTPLGAAYTTGVETAEGRPWAAAAKLAITAVTIAALLWWWSRSLQSAMVGAASSGPADGQRPARGGAVAQLLPRVVPGLRPGPLGAMVARELRYWWRDAKRRANLITIAVFGVFVPMVIVAGSGGLVGDEGAGAGFSLSFAADPTTVHFTALFVGAFAASVLANQFGFDGTSYAMHVTAAVPGRLELRARAIAYSVYMVPPLVVIGVVLALVQGQPEAAPATWGVLFAGYGTGIAVNLYISIFGAYPLPESSNPFATGSGAGIAKSLLAVLGIAAAYAVAAPVLVAAALLGDAWPWVALPVGLGYGLGAAALGSYLAGDVLDRRLPELLAAVTPNS